MLRLDDRCAVACRRVARRYSICGNDDENVMHGGRTTRKRGEKRKRFDVGLGGEGVPSWGSLNFVSYSIQKRLLQAHTIEYFISFLKHGRALFAGGGCQGWGRERECLQYFCSDLQLGCHGLVGIGLGVPVRDCSLRRANGRRFSPSCGATISGCLGDGSRGNPTKESLLEKYPTNF